jgi:hypothetical protein
MKVKQRRSRATKQPANIAQAMQPHELVLSPSVQSAIGLVAWSQYAGAGEPDLPEMVADLRDQVRQVQGGDMRRPEAMLYSQAVVLGSIFTTLIRRAADQNQLKQYQVHMALALKAQAQSRATLEALANLKNPRQVAFVGHANIAHQQQINNGSVPEMAPVRAGVQARARQTGILQNELWRRLMAASWPPERRARQAALIARWKPWKHSTGPRTAAGRSKSSRNAWKGGHWLALRQLVQLVNAEIREARDLVDVTRPTP